MRCCGKPLTGARKTDIFGRHAASTFPPKQGRNSLSGMIEPLDSSRTRAHRIPTTPTVHRAGSRHHMRPRLGTVEMAPPAGDGAWLAIAPLNVRMACTRRRRREKTHWSLPPMVVSCSWVCAHVGLRRNMGVRCSDQRTSRRSAHAPPGSAMRLPPYCSYFTSHR
jgi:hypothetical protein